MTGTTYTLSGLTQLTNYSVTIRAKDAAGNISPESAATTFTTLEGPDTQAPSNVTNLAFTSTTSSVTLTWTAATDNKGVVAYDVYEGAAKVGEATGTSITINNLAAGSVHTYKVVARDAAGNVSSGVSIQTTVKTPPPVDTTAPTKPGPLTSSNVTTTSVKLTWTASTDNVGVTGYDVYQGATKVQTVTAPTATITGLTADTTYSFTVKAFDAAGNQSAASDALSVKTAALPTVEQYSYRLSGTTEIKTLTRGSLPLTGGINAEYNPGSGAVSADLTLNPTQGNLTALGFLPVTAQVQFAPVGKTTGSIAGNGGADHQLEGHHQAAEDHAVRSAARRRHRLPDADAVRHHPQVERGIQPVGWWASDRHLRNQQPAELRAAELPREPAHRWLGEHDRTRPHSEDERVVTPARSRA